MCLTFPCCSPFSISSCLLVFHLHLFSHPLYDLSKNPYLQSSLHALLIFSFLLAQAWFLLSSSFRFLSSRPVWSHLTARSLLLPRLLSSSHGDVRSAALDSGLGTSACLVKFCLHCEVFSHIAAFRSLARKITPLCVWLFAHVFGNPLQNSKTVNSSTFCAYLSAWT